MKQGKIEVHFADIGHLLGDELVLSTREHLQAEAIVCCTGWYVEPPVKFRPQEASGIFVDGLEHPEVRMDMEKAEKYFKSKAPYLATTPRRTANSPEAKRRLLKPPKPFPDVPSHLSVAEAVSGEENYCIYEHGGRARRARGADPGNLDHGLF